MECVTAGDWDRGETAWRETRVIRKNKTRGTRQSGIKTGGPVWKLHSCHASDMLLVGPPGLFLVQGDEMTSHVFVLGYKSMTEVELLEWKLAPFVFCLPALTTAEIWLRFHFTLWFGINRKKYSSASRLFIDIMMLSPLSLKALKANQSIDADEAHHWPLG